MEPKTDKESRSCDDITLVSEIIMNSIYWQAIKKGNFHFFSIIFNKWKIFHLILMLAITLKGGEDVLPFKKSWDV